MSDVQPVEPVPPISPPVQLAHGMGFSRKMPSSAKQSLINLSLGMGIMLAALSGGAYLMITNKEALLGGKASVDKQSSFSFTAPTQVKPGEEFTVDVMLDSSADPEYTISGADAVIQYSFTPEQQSMDVRSTAYPMFTLVKTEPGTIFDSYPSDPSLPVTPPVPKIPCGGIVGVLCPSDMLCQIDMRNVPDASGYCVPNPNKVPEVLGVTTNESKKLALSPPAPQPTFTPPQYGGGSGGPSQTTTPFVPPPTRPPNTPPPNTPVPTSTSVPLVIQGTTAISGIKNYSVDDAGYFMGFSGKGVFVRLTFVANTTGKVELKFAYSGTTATDDSNINGFSKIVPVNVQKSTERLLTAPTSLQVMVANSPPNVSCTTNAECDTGYECYQPGMPPCEEGKACIQVMPASYCRKIPTPTGTPSTSSTPIPWPTPSTSSIPIPSPTILPTTTPRPLNSVSWKTGAITLDADDFEISIHRNGTVKKYYARSGNVTVHSDMNPLKPTLEVQWTENDVPMRLFIYFQNLGSSWVVSEMRTYDGSESGEWIYYKNFDIKSLFNEIYIFPKFETRGSNNGVLD